MKICRVLSHEFTDRYISVVWHLKCFSFKTSCTSITSVLVEELLSLRISE